MAHQAFKEALLTLIHPWLFMSISLRHVPQTILELLSAGNFRTLLSPNGFADALFGNFWATVGPQVKNSAEVRVVPLLEGRVHDGVIGEEVVSKPVGGIVLEIGAGTGMWADVFAKIGAGAGENDHEEGGVRLRTKPTPNITKIYGVEPHPKSAATLRQRVKDLGIDDIYEVIPVGIESLADPAAWPGTTIEPGSVDCIVSILCLCSIPEPAENIKRLYELLKPGGRWYVYEHVRVSRERPVIRLYQWLTNFIWAWFLGSCRLCRETGTSLKQAGPWKEIDLKQPPAENPYAPLPHILGTLTK
ncbi:Methyltransferase-like protein 7B-like protein [Paramyrothecium foliicola]|nr:Methyltransferase-like protein 7B-like protein [Paramyrothecium foliicola]